MKASLRQLFKKMIEKKVIWCVDTDPDQPAVWVLYMGKQRRGAPLYSIVLTDNIGRRLHVDSIMASLDGDKVTALRFHEAGDDYWECEDMSEKMTLDVYVQRKVL